jgi:hypothetical protein
MAGACAYASEYPGGHSRTLGKRMNPRRRIGAAYYLDPRYNGQISGRAAALKTDRWGPRDRELART